jgi:hypothetical protein
MKKVMTEICHFGEDMKELLQEKVCIINVLGQISFPILCNCFNPSVVRISFLYWAQGL